MAIFTKMTYTLKRKTNHSRAKGKVALYVSPQNSMAVNNFKLARVSGQPVSDAEFLGDLVRVAETLGDCPGIAIFVQAKARGKRKPQAYVGTLRIFSCRATPA